MRHSPASRRSTLRPQLEMLEDRCLPSANLVANINVDPNVGDMGEMVASGNLLFFTVDHEVHGQELWRSDGTAGGTFLVEDINPGTGSSLSSSFSLAHGLIDVNGLLYFAAFEPASGTELWRSDGTAEGTFRVKDINPGTGGSVPDQLTAMNGLLYFSAFDPDHGTRLWRSDGTESGTLPVANVEPQLSSGGGVGTLTVVNGTLYFKGFDPVSGGGLWKSDGTEEGTRRVSAMSPDNLTAVDGLLYFTAGAGSVTTTSTGIAVHNDQELWRSDGTEDGTRRVADINPGVDGSFPDNLTAINGTLYFNAFDPVCGTELWKSDGTEANTVRVADINPGVGGSYPQALTDVNGRVFFVAEHPDSGFELWQSDGTASGTFVMDIVPGPDSSIPDFLTTVNGTLFFLLQNYGQVDAGDQELWGVDGAAVHPVPVTDVIPGEGAFTWRTASVNGTLYFGVYDPAHGWELWAVSDADGDGIANAIDPQMLTFSNDFSDGTTTGTITDRGNQGLTLVDAPDPADGIQITADSLGGPTPATISVVNGGASLSLNPGDQVIVTHGSVIVHVLAGTVEATFVADTGAVATASLLEGNELTFRPESFTFVAPTSNTQTVQLLVDGSELNVSPGQTVRSVQIDIKPGSDSNSQNLASNGMISVAILSAAGFDARTVDVASILFAGAHATRFAFEDVNGDGLLDLVVYFRTQDTTLRSLYERLVADDLNEDGVLDSNHEKASIALSGLCQDGTGILGSDTMDLFLSGKALRDMLGALAAAGAI